MNPILIMGVVIVGIAIMASLVSISDDQSSQIDASTQISEKQHARIVEASSLKAIATIDDNISIENIGNVDAEILEMRVLDDNGTVVMKKILSTPILASRLTEMIADSDIRSHINSIRSANNTVSP